MVDDERTGPAGPFAYTAFEKWKYKPIIHKAEHAQLWRDLGDSFFSASLLLVEKVVRREISDDMEGLAAVFLFRHYLELALKDLILRGRSLVTEDRNTLRDEVKEVAHVHELTKLWEWVIRDAKPKVKPESWDEYDTEYVEKCLWEFDAVHSKGFAFRYPGAGGESCIFAFAELWEAMRHIEHVLGGLISYLKEAHAQNDEYESFLQSEYGSEMY